MSTFGSDASSSTKRYDVFISFRGDDTRANFTSHLHAAFSQQGIGTYIDYKLQKGDSVWPALSKAIEESYISVVVFSENYATSTWCLEELVKIIECRKCQGLVVIPVFYNIDPSDIRKQTGSYEKAFAKYERDLKDTDNESNQQKVSKWKAALAEAANMSGWDTRTYENDSQVIQKIVDDVLQKLYLRYPSKLKGLVGIDENCRYIEFLLKKVRVIGIWGMGGLGKTTLAKALFAKLFPQYDSVCFLENVREESKGARLKFLRDKLLFELLKEEKPKSNAVGSQFNMRRLSSQKVLIILDDVADSHQLEFLCGEPGELGPGSTLIITTRNKKLLSGRVDVIYEIPQLNTEESLELFCLNAFKERHPKKGYKALSERAINHAGGVPLALKVLGSYFYSESDEFWKSALSKLEKHPNKEIHDLLRVSYDGLDGQEQNIFLDIAFFFKEENKDHVIKILDACGFYAACGIDVLVNKALITISQSNKIQMHDLLQEMGLEIVRQECSKEPGRRSRLKDIEEVSDVLKSNKGTSTVEGITLDLSQIEDDLHLSADAFNAMPNLRFLKFYIPSGKRSGNLYLHTDLKPFSDKLRYLEWNGYPLKSLPPTFRAKLLVEIHMPHSHITQLWPKEQDTKIQNFVNLEGIDLSECKKLIDLPDLSMASKLKWVNLSGCESLCNLHPSILSHDTLESLTLNRCKKLKRLKSQKHLGSLKKISVIGCTSLREFSVSSDSIGRLDLSNTGIKILYPSIGGLSKLEWLNLEGLRLENLPNELSFLTSLKELRISKCRQIIKKRKLHVLFDGLRSLEILHFKDCCNLYELPDNIIVLSSLRELRLDGSSVERLPTSIKHLKELQMLSLHNCRELQYLPELPPCIREFYADNCTSLVTVSTLKTFAIEMKGHRKYFSFENDLKLDGRSLHCITEGAQFTIMSAAYHNVKVASYNLKTHSYNYNGGIDVCLPGSSVPKQFTHRTKESSMTIDLPSRSNLLGLILCVVLSPSKEMKEHGAKIFCQCYLADGTKVGFANKWGWRNEAVRELNSDHVYVWFDQYHCDSILTYCGRQLSFEFYVTNEMEERGVLNVGTKECGVHLIFESDSSAISTEIDHFKKEKTEIEESDDEESNVIRTHIKNQERDMSEKYSFSSDCIVVGSSKNDEEERQKYNESIFPPNPTGIWKNRTQGLKDIAILFS